MTPAELQALSDLVEQWRTRLYDLGWFMRCMNEHIARQANTEDACTGRFWEGRYKSQALLDEAAVLACMAYVDLNPIRAEIAGTPEISEFTSLYARIKATESTSIRAKIKKSKTTSTQPTPKGLLPFTGGECMKSPGNLLPYDFLDYLALVDWTGSAVRKDKRGAIPEHLAPILLRLGIDRASGLKPCVILRDGIIGKWGRLTKSVPTPPWSAINGFRGCHGAFNFIGQLLSRRLFFFHALRFWHLPVGFLCPEFPQWPFFNAYCHIDP